MKRERQEWYKSLVAEFCRFVAPTPESVILCVGCGPGLLTRELADPGLKVIGVESSPADIEEAKRSARGARRFRQNTYQVGDPNDLPFADEEFEVVLAFCLLYQEPDPAATLSEMARVAKGGGLVAILDPSLEMRLERLRAYVAKAGISGFGFTTLHNLLTEAQAHNQFSRQEIERLFRKAGLGSLVIAESMDRMFLEAKGRT